MAVSNIAVRAFLVAGATGNQGRSVVNALLKANTDLEIITLTRNAKLSVAQRFLQKLAGIKLITFNLDAIDDAFRKAKEATKAPVSGVFSVQVRDTELMFIQHY